jgi:hypothetical protein
MRWVKRGCCKQHAYGDTGKHTHGVYAPGVRFLLKKPVTQELTDDHTHKVRTNVYPKNMVSCNENGAIVKDQNGKF